MGSTTVDVGQNAPDFTMPSDEGKKDPLYEEPEKGPVVLSFYAFDFTGVCTGQLCAMRDAMGELQAHGAKVFGARRDSAASHRAFRAANHGTHPLLSDWNKTVSRDYGVLFDTFGDYLGVSKRSVFVLDRGGVIRCKWATEDAKVPPDATRILEDVSKLAT